MRKGGKPLVSPSVCLCLVAAVTLTFGPGSAPLGAAEPTFQGTGVTRNLLLDGPMLPAQIPGWYLAVGIAPDRSGIVDCRVWQKYRGNPVFGNTVRADPDFVDLDSGAPLGDPPAKIRPSRPFAILTWGFPDFSSLSDGEEPTVAVGVEVSITGSQIIDELWAQCFVKFRDGCEEDSQTICAGGNGDRFELTVDWGDGPEKVPATVHSRDRNGGSFSLGNPSRADLWVGVDNNCRQRAQYGIHILAATGKIPFDVLFTDTQSGTTRMFTNKDLLNGAFIDPAAFSNCP